MPEVVIRGRLAGEGKAQDLRLAEQLAGHLEPRGGASTEPIVSKNSIYRKFKTHSWCAQTRIGHGRPDCVELQPYQPPDAAGDDSSTVVKLRR